MSLSFGLISLVLGSQSALTPDQQLDFWIGEWECSGRSRNKPGEDVWTNTAATNSVRKILGGKVIEENFKMAGFDGKSVSVYDQNSKQWRQTWVDSSGGYLVLTGGRRGDTFELKQVMGPKAPTGLQMRMVFTDIKAASFSWHWQRSNDAGKTWETQWTLAYTRKAKG